MKIETIKTGPWKQNCFILSNETKKAILVDPGDDAEKIITHLEEHKLIPIAIINTHAHFDHVAAVNTIKDKYKIPFYLHKNEIPLLKRANLYRLAILRAPGLVIPEVDILLDDPNKRLEIDDFNFIIHQTPGHTPGGICFEIEGHIFVGDTVLESNLIPNNLPEENPPLLQKSLAYLNSLNANLLAMPGHGKPEPLGDLLKIILKNTTSAKGAQL